MDARRDGKVTNADAEPEKLRVMNGALYIDYQDCKYGGRRRMLCSGLNNYRAAADGPTFRLGGFEVVDLTIDKAIYQVPIELWSPSGLPMTQNPVWVEAGTRVFARTSCLTTTSLPCSCTTQMRNNSASGTSQSAYPLQPLSSLPAGVHGAGRIAPWHLR